MRDGLGFSLLKLPDEVLFAGDWIDLDEHAAAAGVFVDELAGCFGWMNGVFLLDGFHWSSNLIFFRFGQRSVEKWRYAPFRYSSCILWLAI